MNAARRISRLSSSSCRGSIYSDPGVSMRLWGEESATAASSCCSRSRSRCGRRCLASSSRPGVRRNRNRAHLPGLITINYLGNPDNGAILAAYLGSLFFAGGFLPGRSPRAHQESARRLLIALLMCFLPLVAGHPVVTDFPSGRRWLVTVSPAVVRHALREHHQGRARRDAVFRAGHHLSCSRAPWCPAKSK